MLSNKPHTQARLESDMVAWVTTVSAAGVPSTAPVWYMVDIKLDEVYEQPLTLEQLRGVPALAKMELLRRGSRLSVQPVTKAEFATVEKLAHARSKRKS